MADQSIDREAVATDCPKAPLNKRWTVKLSVIMIIVFGVGIYGYYDAAIAYPARGVRYAEWAKWQYLEQAKLANAEEPGVFRYQSSVTNPGEELTRLRDPSSQSSRPLRASMMASRLVWLEALQVVGHLTEEHTVFESPQEELSQLEADWQTSSVPKPLHAFDLIVQWLIMGVCWAIALVMAIHMLRVRAKKYSWVADSMTLTIPGGQSITPEDLEEVDKRKWDKFIVFLKIKSDHATLAGQEIAVDTYQHQFVEDWILAMEEKAFGSQEDQDEQHEHDHADDEDSTTTES
mgnify:CR=1 FL=1|tara:strand:+ start:88636 stop:89508 length:873 start_codon:yes stop_codon:yes gene_type:complete